MGLPEMSNVRLDQIRANPAALREANKNSEQFHELVGSVRDQGVQLPILVRRKSGPDNKEFELVDGLQRFTAASEVGTGIVGEMGLIPVRVVEKDDADALLAQVVGNAHKIETKPAEYAKALMRIIGYQPTMTEAEMAAKLNKSPAWISKQLSLLDLIDPIKPLVNEGKITLANAYVLAKLPPDEQPNWVERAQTESPQVFTGAATARAKEIKDANRKGQNAGEEQFVPVTFLRKKNEIETELSNPETIVALGRQLNVLEGVSTIEEGFRRGAALGLQWALNFDPASQATAKAKWEERKKHEKEEKIRRDAEKKKKRAEELATKEAAARKEAAAAREAAEKLPPVETAPVETAEPELAATTA